MAARRLRGRSQRHWMSSRTGQRPGVGPGEWPPSRWLSRSAAPHPGTRHLVAYRLRRYDPFVSARGDAPLEPRLVLPAQPCLERSARRPLLDRRHACCGAPDRQVPDELGRCLVWQRTQPGKATPGTWLVGDLGHALAEPSDPVDGPLEMFTCGGGRPVERQERGGAREAGLHHILRCRSH